MWNEGKINEKENQRSLRINWGENKIKKEDRWIRKVKEEDKKGFVGKKRKKR